MRSSIPTSRTTASLTRRVSTAPASTASATSAGPYAHGRFVAIASSSLSTSRVSGRKHLAVTRRANRREFSNAVLPELGQERFFVIQRKEGDERLLRRGNGLVDPS